MNPEHFDQLAKALAASTSRRTALRALGAAALAGVLARAGRVQAQSAQTLLKVTNTSGATVTAYLTLGFVDGCVTDVRRVPWNITVIDTARYLQGSFVLTNGQSVTYTPPAGMGISGNVAFGAAPNNCPPPAYPNGVNLAEFILNNAFQGTNAQETIDNSGVDGVNATITFAMSGGGAWNAGADKPNITSFVNKGLRDNVGLVGVFPWGCTNCVNRAGATPCQQFDGTCNPTNICNVQRVASSAGGTVEITFSGFIGPVGASQNPPTSAGPTTCGLLGQACCPGNTCTASSTICNNGTCVGCGAHSQVCCPGNLCQSGPCNNGICADPTAPSCGGIGQPCCIPGNTCDNTSLACIGALCVPKPA